MTSLKTTWNAQQYQERHAYVFHFGEGILEWLAPQPHERIVDLGCGSGQLTARIAEAGALVIGIDASHDMIVQARSNFPGFDFRVGDATTFTVERPVDAVFSNATLHWVKNASAAAQCIARALKPGGRFVAEFGGHRNIRAIYTAIRAAIPGVQFPWYYPTIGQYSSILESAGLEVRQASLFDRPTPVEGEDGLDDWLNMFCREVIDQAGPSRRDAVQREIIEKLRPTLYKDGAWSLDYRRLRVVAIKPTP